MEKNPDMNRLLVVDDDIELCAMLEEYLEGENFQVDMAHDGDAALNMALAGGYDLVVLDVMMPRRNGFDVLRELRAHSNTPVLMLTARGDDVDSIVGLELGADDYLTKPCNPRVLVARIRAILRRVSHDTGSGAVSDSDRLQLGDIELQPGARSVLQHGKPVSLTSTEYSVLEVLLRAAGQVVSKAELSERVLDRELTSYDRSLDMHVSN
ncbi:MAG: response regulator transcription factor, partial [Gammaproteobacteria bacterium]